VDVKEASVSGLNDVEPIHTTAATSSVATNAGDAWRKTAPAARSPREQHAVLETLLRRKRWDLVEATSALLRAHEAAHEVLGMCVAEEKMNFPDYDQWKCDDEIELSRKMAQVPMLRMLLQMVGDADEAWLNSTPVQIALRTRWMEIEVSSPERKSSVVGWRCRLSSARNHVEDCEQRRRGIRVQCQEIQVTLLELEHQFEVERRELERYNLDITWDINQKEEDLAVTSLKLMHFKDRARTAAEEVASQAEVLAEFGESKQRAYIKTNVQQQLALLQERYEALDKKLKAASQPAGKGTRGA
jgi:hypothetical protein